MRNGWLGAAAVLAACSSPGLEYRGVDPVRVPVGPFTYDVYRLGAKAQVIRVNSMLLPDTAEAMAGAVLAAEAATGCAVNPASIEGDAALVKLRLSCP